MIRAGVRVRGLRVEAVAALAFGALLAVPAWPQAVSPSKAEAPAAAPVPLEEFQRPRVKSSRVQDYYPNREIEEHGEGWVNLGLMVDPKGKPFEITVLASTGDKVFEQAAVRALEHTRFEPGTVNGKPIESAIAYEDSAHYLPTSDFHSALVTCFALEVETQRYGEALITWHTLEKMHIDGARKAQLMAVVEQLKALQTDDRGYQISDVMPNGTWSLELFKRHLRVQVSEGRVFVIKLYCSKRYVFFAFDPNLSYEVKTAFGSCRMEMLGDAGTKFTVSQF